jgi:hypothetical protein
MSAHKTVQGLLVGAAISLALAPTALAGPAGDEYLPKVPQAAGSASAGSGSGSGSAFSGTGTTTLPQGSGSKDANAKGTDKNNGKKSEGKKSQLAPVGASGSGGGGDSSGSILLNPIVLLMIAAVIAAAVGMTLWRRNAVDEDEPGSRRDPGSPGAGTPRTPDGEIVAGTDKTA